MQIGLHASHEQFAPSRLLALARAAQDAGFEAVLSSDHLAPWTERQGHSGFAWTWLGAVAATTTLPLGVVSAPGQRYHPAVLAQAVATVAELAPGRLTVALGSGQALNEHVTGTGWPTKAVRNARLRECAEVIRRLLAGETVDHEGLVRVRSARLWEVPRPEVPLFGAALTPATAAEVAAWADGLITVYAPVDRLRPVLDAFREHGGAGKPVHVQVHLSWAPDDEQVRDQALDQWRTGALPPLLSEELELPEQLDAAGAHVPAEALRHGVLMSTDLAWHAARLAELAALGVDRVYLHQVGTGQEEFVEAFGNQVLPRLGAGGRAPAGGAADAQS